MAESTVAGLTIGIDLGTTFSCVATFRNSIVQIIANEHSLHVTPSCVAFEDGQRIVGKEARDNIYLRPNQTVFGVKRIVGRRYDDPVVQQYAAKWPFHVVASPSGLPEIEITETEHVNNESRTVVRRLSPEAVSALVLDKMRTIALDYLGNGESIPLHAVITVPANFNDAQRRATKAAGVKAGLKVLAVVNEPTAAAVAYGLDLLNQTQTILVFDLGGGTLDVSILRIENGRKFTVLSTAGDPNLGGEDFDERLLQHCLTEFERKHNVTIDRKSAGVSRLRLKVEEAKKGLVNETSRLVVSLDAFHGQTHFREVITKARFDELCEDLFAKALEPVEAALQRADLVKSDIDQVVLVGGCSRIPKIREVIAAYFPDQRINKDINADEAIAYGAAVLAHQLSTDTTQEPADVRIEFTDVTPYSLGTEVAGGLFVTIIPQNTSIPAELTREFTTERDNQWWVNIPIYEGEERKARDNRLLGKFRFGDYQRGAAGEPLIDVTFRYDRSGIVHVTAADQRTGRTANVQVSRNAADEDPEDDSDEDSYHDANTSGEDDEHESRNTESSEQGDDDIGHSILGLLLLRYLVDRAERDANLTHENTFPAPVSEFINRFVQRSGDRPVFQLGNVDTAFEGLMEVFASDRCVPLAPLKINYQEGVDRGGVSRDVTHAAWEQAKEYRHGGVALFEGEPYKTVTSQPVEDGILRAVGKFLFACIIHGYAWPNWLDSSMFYYMAGVSVAAESVAQVNSTVGDLLTAVDNSSATTDFPGALPELYQWMEYHNLQASTWKNKDKQEIKDEIAKFELYTRRKGNILLIRDGFNQNHFLQVLRDSTVVHGLMEALCRSVQTATDFLGELEHPGYSEENYAKEKVTVAHLVKYVEEATIKERQDLMIFITGFARIPLQKKINIEFNDEDTPYLPIAQTCSPLICFGIHYTEDPAGYRQFKADLLMSISESHHQFQNR